MSLFSSGQGTNFCEYDVCHNPLLELLRRKQLIVGKSLNGDGGIARDPALALARGVRKASAPIVGWLNEHVGESRQGSG